MNKLNRHMYAGNVEILPDGNYGWWERLILPPDESDRMYTIEPLYKGVAGYILLATAIYGYPSLGLFICQYNNIIDPVNEFIPGKQIRLPTKERIMSLINKS